MPSIHALLLPECVLVNPDAYDKARVIKLLIQTLEAAGKTANPTLFFHDVMAREDLSCTGLDCGCAVPHAHTAALEDTVIAAALLKDGIDFSCPDGQPVKLVFLLAGPEKQARLHLKLLSKMARLLHDQAFRETLMRARSAHEFYTLLKDREA